MEACKIETPGTDSGESFEDIYSAMQENKYWIRFFVRPCCPAPNLEGAIDMLDKLKAEVDKRTDFTSDQKDQIAELIDARKEWYPTSGLCKGSKK